MAKITKITYNERRGRFWVYVDGEYCTSIRERTFSAMGLSEGKEITCEAIKELESHHWKHVYGQSAWDKEKIRLQKVKELIESIDDRIDVRVVGFGADTNEFISGHAEEAGKPDIEVVTKKGSVPVLLVEVTGTERMRGNTYWVRPDKLAYAKNHPNEDVWLILHFAVPAERFVFIQSRLDAEYMVSKKVIRGSTELYVEFTDESPGVVSQDCFFSYLRNKIESIEKVLNRS